jgi:retrograde regulation protein 2
MLPKEEEGHIGAMGVASSFESVRGLVMDLGGGSTQVTWMVAENGEVDTAKTAVSLPYGAAALTKRLEDAHINNSVEALRTEISTAYRDAYESLAVPPTLAHADGGFSLYLSGGGFRGWGYLLLSRHSINPYPVPIINGFKVGMEEFQDVSAVVTEVESKESVFRVSARRARQVQAVAFLVGVIRDTIPKIREVRFCQGEFLAFSFRPHAVSIIHNRLTLYLANRRCPRRCALRISPF